MKTYKIIQTKTGLDMGAYAGETAEDAIRAMLADAGEPEAQPDDGLEAQEQ